MTSYHATPHSRQGDNGEYCIITVEENLIKYLGYLGESRVSWAGLNQLSGVYSPA